MGIQVSTLSAGGVKQVPHHSRQEPSPPSVERVQASTSEDARPAEPRQETQMSDLRRTVSALEDISLSFNRRLKFVLNQDSNDLIVKVIDNETDKVIRVLPPEELQRLHSKIRETMGFLFDRTV